MSEAAWRARAERVLLRPAPPLLRDRNELRSRCPWFFSGASGARLRTVDGQDYLDLEMGRGPNILGYGHPVTDAAARDFRPSSARVSLYHPVEVELAEMLVELVPCAERVLFAKNGTDACTAAVRVARAVTGRDVIISSGYHGFGDWSVADAAENEGFPAGYRGWLEPLELNDRPALERAFDRHRGRIAALIVEPAHRALPEPGFLETCRRLTEAEGVLLIFDEVVTAFRLALGGAQARFGVVPDLACLGKAMANGRALSALVGRHDLMDGLERSFFSMTFGHDNPSFAVASACLNHLRQADVLGLIDQKGERLRASFDAAARRHDLPARAVGFAARMNLDFPPAGHLDSEAQASLFGAALLEGHVLPTTAVFTCEMLADRDIEQAGVAFESGMARIRRALDGSETVRAGR